MITVDGGWGGWNGVGGCTASCGGGRIVKKRECNNPTPRNGGAYCSGDSSQSTNCNEFPCAGNSIGLLSGFNLIYTLDVSSILMYTSYSNMFNIIDAESGFTLIKGRECHARNEIYYNKIESGKKGRKICSSMCNSRMDCVSFEWTNEVDTGEETNCRLSTTCKEDLSVAAANKYWLYLKGKDYMELNFPRYIHY